MGMVEGPECPGGTALGNVNESPEATLAPMPVLPPQLGEYQDMPELEDAEPKDNPREEPLTDVPPAEAGMSPGDLPLLEDGRFKEDKEESLADIPWIEEPLAQPWFMFEAQIRQDKVQHWATMFTWFQAMHLRWEENRRKRHDECVDRP